MFSNLLFVNPCGSSTVRCLDTSASWQLDAESKAYEWQNSSAIGDLSPTLAGCPGNSDKTQVFGITGFKCHVLPRQEF